MNHFFYREEIPLLLPEAHHHCSLVSQALQSSPQSHLFGWVPCKHNSSGQQLPLQLWAIGLTDLFLFQRRKHCCPNCWADYRQDSLSFCSSDDKENAGPVQLLWGWGQRLTPTPLSTASCWDCFRTLRTIATCLATVLQLASVQGESESWQGQWQYPEITLRTQWLFFKKHQRWAWAKRSRLCQLWSATVRCQNEKEHFSSLLHNPEL